MIEIEIYTDGACNQEKNTGGWSFLILQNKETKAQKSGALVMTTNNQCEMWAAIHAIKEIELIEFNEPPRVTLYSDSAYLVNAFKDDWISKWLNNNWINSQGKSVLNKELWEQLIILQNKMKVNFVQIRRCSNEYAKLVDKMAKKPSV